MSPYLRALGRFTLRAVRPLPDLNDLLGVGITVIAVAGVSGAVGRALDGWPSAGIAAAVTTVGLLLHAGAWTEQRLEGDRRLQMRVSDEARAVSISPNIVQASFLVHNDGPASEFEAWVPWKSVHGAGPGVDDPYGGFHLPWYGSATYPQRTWIPRGGSERVDVAWINTSKGVVRFLGPAPTAIHEPTQYYALHPTRWDLSGRIEIRDIARDSPAFSTTFRLKIGIESRTVILRVPEDSDSVPVPADLDSEGETGEETGAR